MSCGGTPKFCSRHCLSKCSTKRTCVNLIDLGTDGCVPSSIELHTELDLYIRRYSQSSFFHSTRSNIDHALLPQIWERLNGLLCWEQALGIVNALRQPEPM